MLVINFLGTGLSKMSQGYNAEYFAQFLPFEEHLLASGFERVGQGSFRRVYERNRVVIKIPINRDGTMDNCVEALGYKKYRNGPTDLGLRLAPCRILPNGCLMMVAVDRYNGYNHPWNNVPTDGEQNGYFKGRLVAYDYACDLTERAAWERDCNFEGWWRDNYAPNRSHLRESLKKVA